MEYKTCKGCGNKFTKPPRQRISWWKTAKFCSVKCRKGVPATEKQKECLAKGRGWNKGIPTPLAVRKKQSDAKKGEKHWNWKGGSWSTCHIKARMIMEEHLGRKLDKNEIVHHKNEDWRDNRVENLEVMNKSKHTKIHRWSD